MAGNKRAVFEIYDLEPLLVHLERGGPEPTSKSIENKLREAKLRERLLLSRQGPNEASKKEMLKKDHMSDANKPTDWGRFILSLR